VASKRRLRRKQCEGKVRYASQEAALTVIRRLRSKGGKDDGHLSPYKCPHCGGIHFGHTPWHVQQAMRDRRRSKTQGDIVKW
jgi:hypothetical protein